MLKASAPQQQHERQERADQGARGVHRPVHAERAAEAGLGAAREIIASRGAVRMPLAGSSAPDTAMIGAHGAPASASTRLQIGESTPDADTLVAGPFATACQATQT